MKKIVTAVSALGILWVLASWADVVLHNTTTFEYATWNLFKILFQEDNTMTRVTYIVTPKNKKEQPFEVKTLKEAVTATSNRTTGDYKVKYTRVEEDLQRRTPG